MRINDNFTVTKPYSSYSSHQRYIITAKEKNLEFNVTFTGSDIEDKILNLVVFDILAVGEGNLCNELINTHHLEEASLHFRTVRMKFDRRSRTVEFEGVEDTGMVEMRWTTPIVSVQFERKEFVELVKFLLEGRTYD